MSASPGPSTDASARRKRRNSSPNGHDENERQVQKQRTQRTTLACERCRMKKLRCMGGPPCGACQRAKAECDFGDRGWDSQQTLSNTNQRLTQLEKTIADLVASLSHLTNPRPPRGSDSPVQPSAARPSSSFYGGAGERLFAGSSSAHPPHHVSALEPARNSPCLETPPLSNALIITAPDPPFAARRSDVSPLAQSRGMQSTTPEPMRGSSSLNPRASERLESRWAALQHNSAPFPPLMSHPTAWSEEPAKTSPDGVTPHMNLGMTSYKAQVHLHSEPVSEGVVGEVAARALFNLFFLKCHPAFPLLEPYTDLDSHFDHIRSSSPFLLTTILAIAARYYTAYRRTQPPATLGLPLIATNALEALADLACAHLGFVLFRKQHRLSDVQATLLLSVWIPRGKGQSADQWMVTGLCTRLAYRIGIPNLLSRPAMLRLANAAGSLDADDVREASSILPQWHTWLMSNHYDISLSLGFGRPYAMPFAQGAPRQYLTMVRKLGPAAPVDPAAAAYVTSLVELSAITTELISGLRTARLPASATAWTKVSGLLSDLNPRLDEWRRQWTWGGSYDTIALGQYTVLVMVYGEHARLCLNSLSLNLLTANALGDNQQQRNHFLMPYLARACEAAVSIVQGYSESPGAESIVRYGGDYLVLVLGQAAIFFVRVLATRLEQPLPVDHLVLLHYLKKAIELLESNDLSSTGVCGWVANLSRDLARHAGLSLDDDSDLRNASSVVPEANLPEPDWDFDISAFLGQNMPVEEAGLDLGGYFDLAQAFFLAPPGSAAAHDNADVG